MQYILNHTGQLLISNTANCPIFIPSLLNDNLIASLAICNETNFKFTPNKHNLDNVFKLYFSKLLAGNMSLQENIADLAIENIFLWHDAKIAKNSNVKIQLNDSKRFIKGLNSFLYCKELTVNQIINFNAIFLPKNIIKGIRKGKMRVGKPQKVSYAFFAPPIEKIEKLMVDTINFIHSKKTHQIDKALISMMQFFFIHPFNDGNGRVFRALTLSLLKDQLGLINSFIMLVYFKIINQENYYLSQKEYRNGNVNEIKNFHIQAINWTNKSVTVLSDFIDEYMEKIGNDKSNPYFSQVVVIVDKSEQLDSDLFKLQKTKGQKCIYLNTALLNVLNQFDYYLRFELRSFLL